MKLKYLIVVWFVLAKTDTQFCRRDNLCDETPVVASLTGANTGNTHLALISIIKVFSMVIKFLLDILPFQCFLI